MAGLKVISPPAVEPVTLNEIKPQLRIELDDTSYDDILTPLVVAAREWCEGYQNRAYITQTLELALDRWPHCHEIQLSRPPLQSVSSVEYGGVAWSSDSYTVDDYSFVGRIVRNRGIGWPCVELPAANGIKARYIAGFGDTADDVPQRIRQAIILLVCHWYENGMCDPPPAVLSLLNIDRLVPV